jgi:gliding motility-associated-like protein
MLKVITPVALALMLSLPLASQKPDTILYAIGIAGGRDVIVSKGHNIEITWILGESVIGESTVRKDSTDEEDFPMRFTIGMHQGWPDLFIIPSGNQVPQIGFVITPGDADGLGLNEYFVPVEEIQFRFSKNELFIFNRWGVLVFQASPYENNWSGTNFQGQDLPEGTYYYLLRLQNNFNSNVQGSVTIRRGQGN